jgi:hypothetical protein
VDESTVQALVDFKRSGRKLVLVTGRELPDLSRCFSRLDLFERVVAENGALLYTPASEKEQPLAPEPPENLIERLRVAGVAPLSVGRSIVATWEPNEKTVLEAIRDLGLELQIVFNKGAVMVLPANVNKASGLKAALDDLGLFRSQCRGRRRRRERSCFHAGERFRGGRRQRPAGDQR